MATSRKDEGPRTSPGPAPRTSPGPAPRTTVDADGVVRTDRPRSPAALLGAAAALAVIGAIAWLVIAVRGGEPGETPTPGAAAGASSSAATAGTSATAAGASAPRPVRLGRYAAPVAPAEPAAPSEMYLDQIDPAEIPAGERTGIHLFPRPGTKPIRGGLIVPEGYQLPPGYMRHYQTTDDGERVPAILVFHPDYQPVDAAGHPIPLPADRVVPPELAPPDMPLEALDPPPIRRDLDPAPPR